jgi:hypothetical protein
MIGTEFFGAPPYGISKARIPLEQYMPMIIEEEVKEVAPRGAESFTTTIIKAEKLGINKSGLNLFN